MARALLVGCGCRGRELGARLLAGGWQVRGTSRGPEGAAAIERAGIEPAVADPDRVATVLDHVADITVVAWLLGSARGEAASLEALHGARLERLCEELVDTPVRGIAYETPGAGRAGAEPRGGEHALERARERWRLPYEVISHDPADWRGWTDAAAASIERLVAGRA